MPRPKKIHKKKSFMFTTKHQSENGIISLVLGILSLLCICAGIYMAFSGRGEVPEKNAAVGLFAALGDIAGIVAACLGMQEKDIYIWVPRIGLIINIAALLIWAVMIISAYLW
ncbi:MAG: hypothetical protein IKS87_07290 [Lachnospiraceae bacterium]|nr:hypothetical protein [Lachnospiraceae bacterium]